MTKQTHRMLPDLGITLCARNYYDPFRIEVYSDLNYGVDGVLGWVIQIPLHTFALTSVGNTPPPNIDRPHLATIAIGKGSKSRTVKIVNRLQTEGLIVQAWEAKKYLVPSGVE